MGLFRNKAVLACLTALCLACGGCASQPEDISPLDADGLIVLTIGTADTGGTMTPVGTAIAQVLSTDQLKFNISTSTGSFMNIQNLSSGEIDLGLVAGDSAYTAVYGTEDSAPTNEDLRAVAAVFSSTSNWMSPIRTGAFYVHDLKGMRIGAGPQGSASELATWAVINALRLDGDGTVLENCSLGAGTDLILSGDLDAIHGFTGAPVSGLAQLPDEPGGVHGDLFYALHVGVEDHLLLEGGGGVVEMEDDVLGAPDGLKGFFDEMLPGLDQHLNGHIVRDVSPLDQLPADLVLRLAGGGEADLNLLDAYIHQSVEVFQLLLKVHGVHKGLVAVPQVHRTPDGGLGDDAVRPGAALDGLGLEGDVLLISGFHMGCLLYILRGTKTTPPTFSSQGRRK